jgi:hypothetical protein
MSEPLCLGATAGKANVAELRLIEGGERLPGAPAAQPTLGGRLDRQDGVHDHAKEVILPQEARVGFPGASLGGRPIVIWA